ncbi:MAG TPA: hypothetical protein ENJ56_02815 [Anaerolineae bacterium]|nr:hypothetical protein [Anaerolineae bacterium]
MWQEQARAAVAGDWVLFDEIPRRYNFVSTPVEPTEPDDLTRIHGIGPKIASILNENGITTFVALAATAPEDIGKLLDAQPGDKFRLATDEVRESWRAQAKAAVAEDWERFKHLAAKFKKLTGSK